MPRTSTQNEDSFQSARRRLSYVRLEDALLLSSALSVFEVIDDWKHPELGKFINLVSMDRFSRVALENGASRRVPFSLDWKTFRQALNHLQEIDHPAGPSEVVNNLSLDELYTTLILPMAKKQFAMHHPLRLEQQVRMYALTVSLPRRFSDEMAKQINNPTLSLNMDTEFKNYFGVSIFQVCRGMLALFGHLLTVHNWRQTQLQNMFRVANLKKSSYVQVLFDTFLPNLKAGWLYPRSLDLRGVKVVDVESEGAFFSIVSRTLEEFSALCRQNPYLLGDRSMQPNPLEHFPVVRMDFLNGKHRYIIPNIRHFLRAMTELPLIRLFDSPLKEAFLQQRGIVQEIYLGDLVATRLPNLHSIPEQTYNRKGSEIKGPDWTFIDFENKTMIVIESKTNRFRLHSRSEQGIEHFAKDAEVFLKAITQSKEKIRELLNPSMEVYTPFRHVLDIVEPEKCITVFVIGEDFAGLSESLRATLYKNSDHLLHSFTHSYLILNLANFELFVEAAFYKIPLYELLCKQYNIEIATPSHQFTPHVLSDFEQIKLEERYIYQFYKELDYLPE